jgi:hypothetical protein
MDQGDDIARNVTGMNGTTLRGTMSPQQMGTLHSVAKDLQSMKIGENAGRGPGSDTVQKIAMSHIAAEAGIPNWLASVGRVPGGWVKRAGDVLYGNADDQVRMKLAELLANPAEAAGAMQTAGINPSQVAGYLKALGQAPALAVPAAVNARQQ